MYLFTPCYSLSTPLPTIHLTTPFGPSIRLIPHSCKGVTVAILSSPVSYAQRYPTLTLNLRPTFSLPRAQSSRASSAQQSFGRAPVPKKGMYSVFSFCMHTCMCMHVPYAHMCMLQFFFSLFQSCFARASFTLQRFPPFRFPTSRFAAPLRTLKGNPMRARTHTHTHKAHAPLINL